MLSTTFNKNTNQIRSGILDAVAGHGSLHFSGSIDSRTLRGNDALLVQIRFRALKVGTTAINGRTVMLGSASVPAQNIATQRTTFVAGAVFQTIIGARHVRSAGGKQSDMHVPLSLSMPPMKNLRNSRQAATCTQTVFGDANMLF